VAIAESNAREFHCLIQLGVYPEEPQGIYTFTVFASQLNSLNDISLSSGLFGKVHFSYERAANNGPLRPEQL